MYPDGDRFGMHVAVVLCLLLSGELMTATVMSIFRNPQMSNTITSLVVTASALVATGFLRCVCVCVVCACAFVLYVCVCVV